MPHLLCPLYPILDASYLPYSILTDEVATLLERTNPGIADPAISLPGDEDRYRLLSHILHSLVAAGVTILQYRNKYDPDLQVLRDATWLRKQAPPSLRILLNDRVSLVKASGCDGVHVGQKDLTPEAARMFLGPDRILGLSTHDEAQLRAGDRGAADYLAVGPVYATGSKTDAEAVVGLEGLRQARALTTKPLVAIGGITLARAAQARAAGADSLAVISAIFAPSCGGIDSVDPARLQKLAEDFLHIFR